MILVLWLRPNGLELNVFTTARQNGFPIEVVRSQEEFQNIYGLILVE
ncbi:MAG: hypothetical protein ACPL6D_03205 [Thermodesulfobacteriota bacterium]